MFAILQKILTSSRVGKCHCIIQLRDCDPVWWIFESSHIKNQYKISAWMVAANWREMAYTSLTQSSSEIWNHNHVCGCACLGSDEMSKFLHRCLTADSEHLNIQRIADCKTGKLVKCNSRLFNHLKTQLTVQSSRTQHYCYTTVLYHALTLLSNTVHF